jgi:hypothetical protein
MMMTQGMNPATSIKSMIASMGNPCAWVVRNGSAEMCFAMIRAA